MSSEKDASERKTQEEVDLDDLLSGNPLDTLYPYLYKRTHFLSLSLSFDAVIDALDDFADELSAAQVPEVPSATHKAAAASAANDDSKLREV